MRVDQRRTDVMYLRAVKENASLSVRKVGERNAKPDVNLANVNASASEKRRGCDSTGSE